MRALLRGLSTVLIVSGALLIIDAGITVLYQEPVSAFLASRSQSRLADDLDGLQVAAPSPLELRALEALPTDRRRIAFLARALKRRKADGDAVGRIRIPRIDVDKVVVRGTGTDDLKRGPGLYPQTPFPGVRGTTAIAGHRTTYGAPFRRVDRLRRGDRIEVEMPYGRFTYEVERTQIVTPDKIDVIRRVRFDRLVLSACHPLYSAAKRIIVFARLSKVQPLGRAVHSSRRTSDAGREEAGR